MRYVIRTEAGEQLWRPLPDTRPDSGYLLFEDEGWMWLYTEPNEEDEIGPRFTHRDSAMLDIASNWEETGDGAPRFLSTIRGQANRARFERLGGAVSA